MLLRVIALAVGVTVVADAGAGQYYGRAGTPFATIAGLMGWADMQTVRTSAAVEIRISSWFGKDPAPLIRLKQADGPVRTEVILWWPSGNYFRTASAWPSGADVHCDAPKEGPQTCVKAVATDLKQDWDGLFRELRALRQCGSDRVSSSPTHTETLQLQISEPGAFREFRCGRTDGPAGPVVSRTLKLLRDIATQAGY